MRTYVIYNARKRRLTRVADGVLAALPGLKSSRPLPPPAPASVREVLVLRTSYLGDVVMALPALRALRRHFTAARITVVTSSGGRELLAPEGVADEILVFEPPWFYARSWRAAWRERRQLLRTLRGRRPDVGIDLRGDLREIALLLWPSGAARRVSYDVAGGGALLTDVVPYRGGHRIDYMLAIGRHIGVPEAYGDIGLADRPAGRDEAASLMARHGTSTDGFVLVHAGTRVELKRYGRLGAVTDRLARDMPVLVLTDAERLSVDGLVELVRAARILVAHDSAPWHVAQAVGTPAVGIFGPSKPFATGLYPGRPGQVVSLDLPCRDRCDETRCRLAPIEKQCLEELPEERVVEAVRALLAAPVRERPRR